MRSVKEVILQLLCEIHEICEKHHITYYLSEELAVMASFDRDIPEHYISGAVVMTADDFRKFTEILEREPRENRELESMKNSPLFPGFYANYVDTTTLFFDRKRIYNVRHNGIFVRIKVLRPKGRYTEFLRAVEQTWESISLGSEYPGKRLGPILAKILNLKIKKKGMEETASSLFDFFVKWYSKYDNKSDFLIYSRRAKPYYTIKRDTLNQRQILSLSGKDFFAYGRDKSEFESSVFRYLVFKDERTRKNSTNRFFSTEISYKELDLNQFRESMRDINIKIKNAGLKYYKTNRKRHSMYRSLIQTHGRFYYGMIFDKQLDEMEEMSRNGSIAELKEILDPYVGRLTQYKNIFISDRINELIKRHYGIDVNEFCEDVPDWQREGIKIYDFKGEHIKTIMED